MATIQYNKEPKRIGFFDERRGRVTDDIEKLVAGDINAGEMTLRLAGETGGVIGDVLGMVITPAITAAVSYVPDEVKEVVAEGAMDVIEGVMDTEAAQATLQYMQENPEVARNVSMAFSALDLLPAQALAGGGWRAIKQNVVEEVKTTLPGFYAGGLQSVQAFAKGVKEGLPAAIKRPYSPFDRAQAEAFGTGKTRRKEYVTAPTESERTGNLLASSSIRGQAENRLEPKTLIDISPTVQGETLSLERLGNRENIDKLLVSQLPDTDRARDIARRMTDRFLNDLSPPDLSDVAKGNKRGMAELGFRTTFTDVTAPLTRNAKLPPNTQVRIRDLGATKSDLRNEVRAHSGVNQRGLLAVNTPEIINAYKAADKIPMGAELNPKQMREFLVSTTPFERGNWANGKLKDELKKIYKGGKGQKEAQMAYYGAKAAKNPTKQQKELIAAVEARQNPNAVHLDDDGVMWYSAPYASTDKYLGGVPARIAIDTADNNRVYNGISDGHDIFGIDPAGGDPMINLTPVQTTPFGGVGNKKDLAPTASAKAKEEAAAAALEAYTKIPRRTADETMTEYLKRTGRPARRGPESVEEYYEKVRKAGHEVFDKKETGKEYAARVKAATGLEKQTGEKFADFEKRVTSQYPELTIRPKDTKATVAERTGILPRETEGVPEWIARGEPILKAETPFAYQKRVMEEYVAPVEARHRLGAAKTGMLTGIAAIDTSQEEETNE